MKFSGPSINLMTNVNFDKHGNGLVYKKKKFRIRSIRTVRSHRRLCCCGIDSCQFLTLLCFCPLESLGQVLALSIKCIARDTIYTITIDRDPGKKWCTVIFPSPESALLKLRVSLIQKEFFITIVLILTKTINKACTWQILKT